MPQAFGPATYDVANELTAVGSTVSTYDQDGNLTNDGTTGYTWNARNQLVSSTKSGATATYAHDGLDRRTGVNIAGTNTAYLYDGVNAVQENVAGTATANLLTGGTNEIYARNNTSLLTDVIGSTVAVADASGAITGEYTYSPFGAATLSGTDAANSTRFAGEHDDPTGLTYDHARYYSPTTRRFISTDPLGLAGGYTNLYSYVGNDPTDLIDPLGLKSDNAASQNDPATSNSSAGNGDNGQGPSKPSAKQLRNSPGVATGNGKPITSGNWLRGSEGNAGVFPRQIADRLRGQQFDTFNDFREAFWKEVGNDPVLSASFTPGNVTRMQGGNAPFVVRTQQYGGGRNYVLHHAQPIQWGGGVYDMDNIVIVTPLYHSQVLDTSYHYGNG